MRSQLRKRLVGKKHSWKYLSLVGDKRISNLQRTKVYVFSDSVLCFGKIHQNPDSNEAWKNRIVGVKSVKSCRNFDGINGEPTEFEWNIFPGFNSLQLSDEVKSLLLKLGETPEIFTGRILFMPMTFPVDQKTMTKNASRILKSSLFMQRSLVQDNGHSLVPVLRKWYSIKEDSPQGIWDNIAEKMSVELAESGCPIFRATTPLSRGELRSKGHGKLSIHCPATQETIETIFRIIVSANQLSLYGAVAEMCEENESLHDRSGRPDMVMAQSIVLSAIKTEVSLDCDDPTNQDLLLQQYGERIEKLSQQDKLSKFCMDSGFLNVVEIRQYFVTKDTGDLTQFHAVACREYTLPREEDASLPRGWIQ